MTSPWAISNWNVRYFLSMAGFASLWRVAYAGIQPLSAWLAFSLINGPEGSHSGSIIEFFIYDTVKILLLLVALIYGIAWLRASLRAV